MSGNILFLGRAPGREGGLAAVSLALHVPNVVTVALTATFAPFAQLAGLRARVPGRRGTTRPA